MRAKFATAHSTNKRLWTVLVVFAALLTMMRITAGPSSAQSPSSPSGTGSAASQQVVQRERVVDDKYSYSDCPIKIVKIKTKKHEVSLREAFSDDDDWLRGIAIEIENKSGKVVTHVGIAMRFDRPAEQADPSGALWDIWYGVSPFAFKDGESIPPPQVRTIQPGETAVVVLSDADHNALNSFLQDIKFPSSIERVHISVATVGFDDGAAWRGILYRRDRRGTLQRKDQ